MCLRIRIAFFPPELLLETFAYLDIEARVAARAVCRAWRAVSVAAGPVTVPGRLAQDPGRFRAYLDQMRAAPLLYDGAVEINDRNLEIVAAAVTSHMDHTLVLDLRITVDGYDEENPEEKPIVFTPGSRLQRVRLSLHPEFEIARETLLDSPQLMTHCYLDGCDNLISAIWTPQVRVLVLVGDICWFDLEIIFEEMDALEDLTLGFRDTFGLSCAPAVAMQKPNLKRLSIYFPGDVDSGTLGSALTHFDHSSIASVSFAHKHADIPYSKRYFYVPSPPESIFEALSTPDIVSLDLSCSPETWAMRLTSSDGRKRVHTGLSRETLVVLLQTVPLDIPELTISGLHHLCPTVETVDQFASIRTLTVLVHGRVPELSIPRICCPALEELTLTATKREYDRAGSVGLAAADVCALRDKLRADLRTLRFLGVCVDDSSMLRTLAKEVEIKPYAPLAEYVYPEDDRRWFGEDLFGD